MPTGKEQIEVTKVHKLSPFGGGRTKEIGVTEDSFRVEFEMTHPVFGRTLAYTGNLRIEASR